MDKYQSDARASIGGMRGMGGGGGRMRGAPVRHAKDFKGTCKMLWYFMGSLKYWLFLVVGIAAAVSGLGVAIPILVGKIVDAMGLAAGQADFALLYKIITVLAVVYLTDLILIFLRGYIMAGVSQ